MDFQDCLGKNKKQKQKMEKKTKTKQKQKTKTKQKDLFQKPTRIAMKFDIYHVTLCNREKYY